jgi:hypothetical protein
MSIRYNDDSVVLWNYADDQEGVVETRSWGYCTSETCQHWSHDPYFEYYVTIVSGKVVWEGENGEGLVVSGETGRVFFTVRRDCGHYAPLMFTEEIAFNGILPPKTLAALNRYPKRHIVSQSFWEIFAKLKEERAKAGGASGN